MVNSGLLLAGFIASSEKPLYDGRLFLI